VTALGAHHPTVAVFFEQLSTVLAVPTEAELLPLQAATALMGPFFALQRTAIEWLRANGTDSHTSGRFIKSFYHGVAGGRSCQSGAVVGARKSVSLSDGSV
jgi:hypothetical protein